MSNGRTILSAVVRVMLLIEITLSCVDYDDIVIAMFVDNSLLVAVIVLAVIAIVLFIAGVILLILYIKVRATNKRWCRLCFFVS